MSPSQYLTVDNLYVVPILRQRLAFAALVRGALHALSRDLEWDGGDDLFCVSLPGSIREKMHESIELLPTVTQIWAWNSAETGREVIAVTPCDGFVEAIRIGSECSVSVEFIDAEVRPGNLLRSPCERHPEWIDDSLVQSVGIDAYRRAVEPLIARPPFRSLPIDAWREALIVQRLRQLMPLWRRVVLVCDMSLVHNVMRGVSAASAWHGELPDQQKPGRFTIQKTLNLTATLNQLDDYPKLVELYEQRRNWGEEPFDKSKVLLEEVTNYITHVPDISKSTRQFEKFSIYLNNILNVGRRRCPEPGSLYDAISGCFGRALGERMHCHLTSYFNQVAVERVRPRSFGDRTTFRYSLDISSADGGFGARECQPVPPQYRVTPQLRPRAEQRGAKNSEYEWPAENEAVREANRKLQGLMLARTAVRKTRKFEGAVEGGVDIRRTLRSSLSHVPSLYVRQTAREPDYVDVQREPVIWVLRNDIYRSQFIVGSHGFEDPKGDKPVSGRQHGAPYFVASQDFIYVPGNDIQKCILKRRDDDDDIELMGVPRLGRLTFGIQFTSEVEARKAYADDFEQCVPNHMDFEHPGEFGCIHRSLVHLTDSEASWLEIAFMTALEYCKFSIVLVLPNGIVLPHELAMLAARTGKRLFYVSLDKFSRAEQDRLRTHYRLAQTQQQYSYQYFQRIMAQFWT